MYVIKAGEVVEPPALCGVGFPESSPKRRKRRRRRRTGNAAIKTVMARDAAPVAFAFGPVSSRSLLE